MAQPKLSAPIGLREAVILMGRQPTETEVQRLRRLIKRREVLIQDKIMVQASATGKYQTTLAILRSRMPDLFEPIDVGPIQEALADMREEMAELRERDAILLGELKLLKEELAAVKTRQQPSLARFR